jgi:hypothetical protein
LDPIHHSIDGIQVRRKIPLPSLAGGKGAGKGKGKGGKGRKRGKGKGGGRR